MQIFLSLTENLNSICAHYSDGSKASLRVLKFPIFVIFMLLRFMNYKTATAVAFGFIRVVKPISDNNYINSDQLQRIAETILNAGLSIRVRLDLNPFLLSFDRFFLRNPFDKVDPKIIRFDSDPFFSSSWIRICFFSGELDPGP